MLKTYREKREEARRLFLTGAMTTNAKIAAHLNVKPHTVGRWRKDEDWDDMRIKIDRRAAEEFVGKIATDRVALNVRHYRFWDLTLAKLAATLKSDQRLEIRDLERVTAILERSQRGQRIAKGLSTTGETEEGVRAEAQAEVRRLIDSFVESVKEHVPDEETRERIRQSILESLPEEEVGDAGDTFDPSQN